MGERSNSDRELDSVLGPFVAFDLETTGLDPQQGRIIEVGAVRVEGGRIVDRFERLVNPRCPIPLGITRLTGLSQADCADQPGIEEVLPHFIDFVSDHTLVAHNAPFDLEYLQEQLNFHLPHCTLNNLCLDTLVLARILLPWLKNHRLDTLLDFFGIKVGKRHRAGADAEAVAQLTLALIDWMGNFELSTVQTLNRLLSGTGSPLGFLFEAVTQQVARGVLSHQVKTPAWSEGWPRESVCLFGPQGGDQTPETHQGGLNGDRIAEIFQPRGALEEKLTSYEYRPQQVEMAREVVRAFNRSEFLMVEAGTGIGKSLAYLIPAVYWAVQNGTRVIVSTKTKNLQEQLFFKDLPLLQEVLEVPFRAILLKGRANYLCLSKWYSILLEPELKLTPEERLGILPLVTWLEETTTGDIAENTGFSPISPSLWGKICSESDYCLEQSCKYFDRCYLQRVRRAARQAQIVVVNHSLLFSDLASDNSILSEYEFLIFDEAHRVEKVATEYLGRELNPWRVRNLFDRLYARGIVELGTMASLRRRIGTLAKEAVREALSSQVEVVIDAVELGRRVTGDFFQRLAQKVLLKLGETGGPYRRKLRYQAGNEPFDAESVEEFAHALGRLGVELSKLAEWIRDLPQRDKDPWEEVFHDLTARAQECTGLIDDILFLTKAEDEDFVYWLELPHLEESQALRLLAAPLDIGELMKLYLYDRLNCIVFTSATLAVGGSFDYMMARLGLDIVEAERLRTLSLGSPFDYQQQSLVGVPTFLPSPKDRQFQAEVSHLIEELTISLRRGTLALFTSHDMLARTYWDLKPLLEQEDILLLGQGLDGPRSAIMDLFREEGESVLLGTESFWEGVDVPGESLQILLVVRLPFAVPTDPLVEARMERLERMGLNPFTHYSIPEAVMKLRQGFGRLIRNKDDRGAVLILDKRIVHAWYGDLFLRSLPTRCLVFRDKDKMLQEIEGWFEDRPPRVITALSTPGEEGRI